LSIGSPRIFFVALGRWTFLNDRNDLQAAKFPVKRNRAAASCRWTTSVPAIPGTPKHGDWVYIVGKPALNWKILASMQNLKPGRAPDHF